MPAQAQAQDDATILSIKAQVDAGLDIITDGEIRRESYSNRFATALEVVDLAIPVPCSTHTCAHGVRSRLIAFRKRTRKHTIGLT